jgi:hypothetical protein
MDPLNLLQDATFQAQVAQAAFAQDQKRPWRPGSFLIKLFTIKSRTGLSLSQWAEIIGVILQILTLLFAKKQGTALKQISAIDPEVRQAVSELESQDFNL